MLACDNIEQAVERAGAKAGNRGADAAMVAVEMADLYARIEAAKKAEAAVPVSVVPAPTTTDLPRRQVGSNRWLVPRRRSREIALQILHQIDVGGVAPESDAERRRDDRALLRAPREKGGPAYEEDEDDGTGELAAKIDRPLVQELVRGVTQHWAELDDTLTKLSQNWRLERMAVVERNVIRIALYELKYCEGVPVNVVLNEAIELAKRYGTSEGAAFTNGLLDRAVGELGIRR